LQGIHEKQDQLAASKHKQRGKMVELRKEIDDLLKKGTLTMNQKSLVGKFL